MPRALDKLLTIGRVELKASRSLGDLGRLIDAEAQLEHSRSILSLYTCLRLRTANETFTSVISRSVRLHLSKCISVRS
jgi:hypothetical protein